jgi:nicotinate-nucleotide pyrophosphorylase (carboxylating)
MELTSVDVRAWLAEDIGAGDATTLALIGEDETCEARILLKEHGVLCGLDVAAAIFEELGARLEPLAADGDSLDGPVARVTGPAHAVLTGERLALNVLGRLSGIATQTRRYVDVVEGTGATILDTRKTTPGLRELEKYAVRCGGGTNHRFRLDDGVLIKDNHVGVCGGVAEAVRRAKAANTGLQVQVEVDRIDQIEPALAAGADRLLLDNMDPPTLREAVRVVGGRVPLEASGGVTLETIRFLAETGVDFISVGRITQSAPAVDIGLDYSLEHE